MSKSKRYNEAVGKVDKNKVYSLEQAIALVKESPVKFDAGVELHMRLGIDAKKSDQLVRSTVVLPHGTGKTKRVAAFVTPEQEDEAKEAGADVIGSQDVIEDIKKTGKCDFDVAVATPDVMKTLGPIAKTLGQQGLMPSPKTETVGTDIKKMVSEMKGGKIAYRNDDTANLHVLVGRVSFTPEQLTENIKTVIESVQKAKPEDTKGTFLKSIAIASSMGPGIRVTVE